MLLQISPIATCQFQPVGIAGYIEDSEGDPVNGASVIIKNNNTGETTTTTSNVNGLWACSLSCMDGNEILVNASKGDDDGSNTTTVDISLLTNWCNVTIGISALISRFAYYPLNPKPDQLISFRDQSYGDIEEWQWYFGDSSTAIGKNQEHSYDEEGTYTVTLEIRNGANFDRSSKTISVNEVSLNPYIPQPKPPKYPEGYDIEDMYKIIGSYDLPRSDNEITIVVIDSGVFYRIYNTVDLAKIVKMQHNIFMAGDDDNGHGTFTNYEIAYLLQKKLPNSNHISYKAFDRHGESASTVLLESLEAVKMMKPDIVSISAGAIGNPNDAYSHKIKELRDSGIIVVVSAGNLGPSPSTVLSPGCCKDAIAIGASDPEKTILNLNDDTICDFSSRGPVPIVNEYKPDVVAPGESIRGPWCAGEVVYSGTSFSAPLISASCAVVLANNKPLADLVNAIYFWEPTIPNVMEESIEENTVVNGDPNAWGAGIPQFDGVSNSFHFKLMVRLIAFILIIVGIFIGLALLIYFRYFR